jgi:hypothetical protein
MGLLLLSVAGVAGLTLLAWMLGFRATPRLDEAEARAQAARIPGFRPGAVALSGDGRAALVAGEGGRFGLVLPLGDRFIVRAVARDAIEVGPDAVRAHLGEPLLRSARLVMVPPPWLGPSA